MLNNYINSAFLSTFRFSTHLLLNVTCFASYLRLSFSFSSTSWRWSPSIIHCRLRYHPLKTRGNDTSVWEVFKEMQASKLTICKEIRINQYLNFQWTQRKTKETQKKFIEEHTLHGFDREPHECQANTFLFGYEQTKSSEARKLGFPT